MIGKRGQFGTGGAGPAENHYLVQKEHQSLPNAAQLW